MPAKLLDLFGVSTGRDGERYRRVAEVVDPKRGEAGSAYSAFLLSFEEGAVSKGATFGRGEDQALAPRPVGG